MKQTVHLCLCIGIAFTTFGAVSAEIVSSAKARVKVVSIDGQPTQAPAAFSLAQYNTAHRVSFKGSDWSDWLPLTLTQGLAPCKRHVMLGTHDQVTVESRPRDG
jgi:hypothetical protein